MVRARVRARMQPASYDVVSALLPGSDPAAGEVVLTAHLCHESAGANDNASGSAAILEVARALEAGVARGALPQPRRGIRFLWLPEIAGSQAWLVRHPELARRLVGGVHMDMVGGLLATTKGTFHLSRTAASRPHVVDVVAQAFFDDVVRVSAAYAERGGDPRAGLVWLPGSREAFLGDVRDLELGSDHEVFEEASFGVPMAYFHDWPDVTIHTNKDQPENLDATKLGRVAYLGAGIAWTLAALPDAEAGRLLALARAAADDAAARGGAARGARDRRCGRLPLPARGGRHGRFAPRLRGRALSERRGTGGRGRAPADGAQRAGATDRKRRPRRARAAALARRARSARRLLLRSPRRRRSARVPRRLCWAGRGATCSPTRR